MDTQPYPVNIRTYRHASPQLGWGADAINCKASAYKLEQIMAPAYSTTSTTKATCNGNLDPPSCLTEYTGKCNDTVIGEFVRDICPVMCGTCDTCNSACIPKGVKRKDGQPDCCTEGQKTLKCPGPAHYQCGAHTLQNNQTTNVGGAKPAVKVV